MAKIKCGYEIYNTTKLVNPNDIIEGKLTLLNDSKKEKRFKRIEIRVMEKYEHFKQSKNYSGWRSKKKTLERYSIATEDLYQPDESKEYPFKIKLPPMWVPKTSTGFRDWHVTLDFRYKTGMLESTGAICILPVLGSVRPPSYSALPKEARMPSQTQTQSVVVNVQTTDVQGANKEEETKFCSLCGKKIKKIAVFCEHCGGEQ